MRILDLFSGIGGFSLGLERAGMRTVAFCEIEPFCQRVLRKHWPEVPIYDDVRSLSANALSRDGIAVDLICGGFPCQDISCAGKGAGLAGERSGLWREFARLIGELRPSYVIVENVAALLSRGLDAVLADLATLGFDAEWHCIPAAAVGAPHRRDRIWIIAYPGSQQHEADCSAVGGARAQGFQQALMADATRERPEEFTKSWSHDREASGRREIISGGGSEALADANGAGRQRERQTQSAGRDDASQPFGRGSILAYADCDHGQRRGGDVQMGRLRFTAEAFQDGFTGRTQWLTEPDVGRVAHGVPARVDRLRGLGNAVVPQIPELIGQAILAHSQFGARFGAHGQVGQSGADAERASESEPAKAGR